MHQLMTRGLVVLLLGSLSFGCSRTDSLVPMPDKPTVSRIGTEFDPSTVGTIRGQVVWDSPVPTVTTIHAVTRNLLSGKTVLNPLAPKIDAKSTGVGDLLVYLHHVDLARAKPWPERSLTVVVDADQINLQAEYEPVRAAGFVRRGDPVQLVSHGSGHQMIRARGAAYWTLPFPDADQPLVRQFDQPGVVELTNAAGAYWQSAELLISEHPYVTMTDGEGRFQLPDVPEGDYELVARVRDWHVASSDRDPESGLILRQHYRPAVEKTLAIHVRRGETEFVQFQFRTSDFGR